MKALRISVASGILAHMRAWSVCVILMGVSACLDSRPGIAEFCAPDVLTSPVRGPDDAFVTMVEFSDFECPYCARVTGTLHELAAAYPDDLRLVFKHFPLPFHAHAMDAAVAAECAGEQGLFWAMHDFLFDNQEALEADDLAYYAAQIGVSLEAFDACRASAVPAERIAADQVTAKLARVNATPTFFINGRPLEGAAPKADFEKAIARALDEARASGLAPSDYYAELIAKPCE